MSTLNLESNLIEIQERISEAAKRSGRAEADITIVAVSKTQPREVIDQAIAAGLRVFGENRMQEAQEKFGPRGERGEIELHLIGSLQRNKARRAAGFFDTIQSLDRGELATDLDRHLSEVEGVTLPVLIEVNISGEAQKGGCEPDQLVQLAETVVGCSHLHPRGLMGVAAQGLDEAELRRTFARLRELRDDLARRYPDAGWTELSMGMSNDFEAAIIEGATMVRLGRVLFGERATGNT